MNTLPEGVVESTARSIRGLNVARTLIAMIIYYLLQIAPPISSIAGLCLMVVAWHVWLKNRRAYSLTFAIASIFLVFMMLGNMINTYHLQATMTEQPNGTYAGRFYEDLSTAVVVAQSVAFLAAIIGTVQYFLDFRTYSKQA